MDAIKIINEYFTIYDADMREYDRTDQDKATQFVKCAFFIVKAGISYTEAHAVNKWFAANDIPICIRHAGVYYYDSHYELKFILWSEWKLIQNINSNIHFH